jgi:hypothetical protein
VNPGPDDLAPHDQRRQRPPNDFDFREFRHRAWRRAPGGMLESG